MVDGVLIAVAVIISLVLMGGIVTFMVYMQHPEDKNTAWFPKLVVFLGLFLACSTVLLVPFDVAMRGSASFTDMGNLWYAAFITIGCFALVLIPFTIFFYETDEDDSGAKRICTAIAWTSIAVFVFAVLTAILYVTVGFVELPVQSDTSPLLLPTDASPSPFKLDDCSSGDLTNKYCSISATVTIRTTAAVYILAMLSFFGWWLMLAFGGIGMFSLPMDLINDFRTRPVPIDLREFAEKKLELKHKTSSLLQLGKEMEAKFRASPNKRKERAFTNKFKAMVYALEGEYARLMVCYKEVGGNPIIPYFKLFLGVMSLAVSISWVVQIILIMFLKGCDGKCPFLNKIFIDLNDAFPLFGTCAFGVFAFYLLWAVIKGCIKFGMRFFFLVSIHPMKVGGTLMNSFLFNTLLILLCSTSVVQFCTQAFGDYTRLTAVSQIFVSQVQYLKGLGALYSGNAFYYMFIIFAFLSLLYGLIEPMCRKKKPGSLEEMMASRV